MVIAYEDGKAGVGAVRGDFPAYFTTVLLPACLFAFAAGLLAGDRPARNIETVMSEVVSQSVERAEKTEARADAAGGAARARWVGLTEASPWKTALAMGEEAGVNSATTFKSRPRAPAAASLRPQTIAPAGAPALIALIIDDLGLDPARLESALTLPDAVTLSFLSYGATLPFDTERARRAGHEVMLHAPMAPAGSADPGPGALTAEMRPSELAAALERQLSRFDGFVGVNNHMGSHLTADLAAMATVMQVLARRDLLFIDSRTTPFSVAGAAAQAAGLRSAERDVFLDPTGDGEEEVRASLARLEEIARAQGAALGIGHPHETTIAAIRTWADGLEARGIKLVPIRAYVERVGGERRLADARTKPAY